MYKWYSQIKYGSICLLPLTFILLLSSEFPFAVPIPSMTVQVCCVMLCGFRDSNFDTIQGTNSHQSSVSPSKILRREWGIGKGGGEAKRCRRLRDVKAAHTQTDYQTDGRTDGRTRSSVLIPPPPPPPPSHPFLRFLSFVGESRRGEKKN